MVITNVGARQPGRPLGPADAAARRGLMARRAAWATRGRAPGAVGVRVPGLLVRAAGPQLDPGEDADGHEQQPGGEQQVDDGAEQGNGQDGGDDEEDEGDDGGHDDLSPIRCGCCALDTRVPPAARAGHRDQPGSHPGLPPGASGSSLTRTPRASWAGARCYRLARFLTEDISS